MLSYRGNQFLTFMDEFMGYLFVISLGKKTCAEEVEKFPHDNPRFQSAWLDYLKPIGYISEVSSAYYYESNRPAKFSSHKLEKGNTML